MLTYTTEKTLFCFCLSLHIKYTLPSTACKVLYLLPAYNFNLISFCNIYWDASSKLLFLSWTSLTASHHLTFSEAVPSGWNTALALIYSFLVQDTVLDLPPPWLSAVIFQNKHYVTQGEKFSDSLRRNIPTHFEDSFVCFSDIYQCTVILHLLLICLSLSRRVKSLTETLRSIKQFLFALCPVLSLIYIVCYVYTHLLNKHFFNK